MQEDCGQPNLSYSDSDEEVKVEKLVALKRVPDATTPCQTITTPKEPVISQTRRPNSPA